MFADKLSESLLRICETRKLTYCNASMLCDVSERYFGDVVRQDSSPAITVFEKFCNAFDKTPNEMLGFPSSKELTFRVPKPIKSAYCFHLPKHLAICPQCQHLIETDYSNYCSHCGQALSWDHFEEAELIELT